ncbi:MAG TPA: ABC transporter permease [bacterium]|nr:ABC transporter permease [bacterium]
MNELVIKGNRPPGVLDGLREVWFFREVVWAFAERNVRLKYKQATLGVAWAIIQPLAFLGIFTVIFGRFAELSKGNHSYAAYALSVLVPWIFLQTAVSIGAQMLVLDGTLVKKVYFAREAPILGAVLATGLDFIIGLALVLIMNRYLGGRLAWTVLLAAPLWLLMAILAAGLAMTFGALTVYYRDFRYALPILLQLWMFASPVAYPLTAVPAKWRALYVLANPAAGILDAFRRILVEGVAPDGGLLFTSTIITLITAWVGYLIFKRMEPGFADAI